MHRKKFSYPCLSTSKRKRKTEYPELAGYKTYLVQHRGVQSSYELLDVAVCFFDFISAKDKTIKEIGQREIDDFITEQGAFYKRKTVAGIASFLRSLFKYLYFIGAVEKDFSESVRRPCIFQGERDPRYLKPWQVKKVLDSVERESMMGKRDYAILLTLAVYGLRSGEVARLTLDDLRWRAKQIVIRNRKCADAIELPMVAEVGRAISEYLRVRPAVDYREVFLTPPRPFHPLKTGTIGEIARRAIERCGISIVHPGAQTFRFSRAQSLFQAERPMDEIAGILGHRDFRTTLGYLSFVVHPLREVAINDGEVLA